MKQAKKVLVIVFLLFLAVLPLSAQNPTIATLEDAIDDAAEILGKTMITNSGIGLNWSDAYIGQLIGMPPHFGIGASAGFTAISLDDLDDIYKQFDSDGIDSLDIPVGFLPLPAVAGEIRIGGFFLPFDIGIKALPLPEMEFGDMKVKYMMVGGDFRYALMQEKGWAPAISVGIGFTYTNVELSSSLGDDTEVDLSPLSGYTDVDKLLISAPDLNFSMENKTVDLKVQVSKKLFIITPYLGLGVSYGWSTVDLEVDSDISDTIGGIGLDPNVIKAVADATGLSLSDTSLKKSNDYSGFGLRGFGGLSLNIFVLRLDVTGLYDIINSNWGASLGLRIQI
ncbi:MAG: hypothetical protein LBP29_04835 [Treponema sp.]|jgi:hypothetical protein|nr:hypothetical protein [Treponema sp.]